MAKQISIYCPYCKRVNPLEIDSLENIVFSRDLCVHCGQEYSFDVEWEPKVFAFKL